MLYRPDRIARPAAWAEPIGPGDLWCDDPEDPHYNHHVRAPFAASHEKLRRADRLYDLVIVTDWNWPVAKPGRGSAIFLHRWRRPGAPTEGCVAFRPDHLAWIAARIVPGTRLIVQA
jgi:L,D-peptidoglycan transpeptidase YkuD (ErfK/YbiS/YcfS/YnhG family)